MASWEMLPIEIMTDILARLPMGILIKIKMMFEQFSEQYCAMIQSQDFEKLHISQAAKNNRLSPLVFVAVMRHLHIEHNIQFPTSHCKWFRPNFPCIDGCPENRHIESICNGLVLIAAYTQNTQRCSDVCQEMPTIFLWNPATRKSTELWNASLSPQNFHGTESCISFCQELIIGFGCDDKVDDIKVVRFHGYNAIVYSSSTGVWKPYENIIPEGIYHSAVHIDGFLFWLGLNSLDGDFVLSFDISKEVFSRVTMPTPQVSNNPVRVNKFWKLCVYGDDSLALVTLGIPTLHEINVWVMKIDSDSSEHTRNWMKIDTLSIHHFIPNYLQNSCPVCKMRNPSINILIYSS